MNSPDQKGSSKNLGAGIDCNCVVAHANGKTAFLGAISAPCATVFRGSSHFVRKLFFPVCTALPILITLPVHADTQNTSLTREQWHKQLGWDTSDCPIISPSTTDSGVRVFTLGSKLTLIQVECTQFAYQANYYFYLQDGQKIKQQKFQQFESLDVGKLEAYTSVLVTGSPTIQPSTKTLFVLRKYRGYGNCGQYLEYRLRAHQWVLKQLRENECTETFPAKPVSPQNWLVRRKP